MIRSTFGHCQLEKKLQNHRSHRPRRVESSEENSSLTPILRRLCAFFRLGSFALLALGWENHLVRLKLPTILTDHGHIGHKASPSPPPDIKERARTVVLFFNQIQLIKWSDTIFFIEIFATFETSGNFRSVDAHFVMSVRRLINGQPLKIGIFHFHFSATRTQPTYKEIFPH